ncbi:hypothetical protein SISSUDRAFT_1056913 [Sistotremastrum suecicum HHB10207 ss-3]|uniref:Ino eighty subunit 1 n=1 Tax=Sistotremastrum suecicum HHB10207 ss-3 TaxID=1314776 RepID=A0A166JC04_9AGAM|nr:hypothetical protein SISSUDRAFT_1056913 [Sistotremastrum suecicum HHB10207 ss-3]
MAGPSTLEPAVTMHRKHMPIKKADGEPFTRHDIQYDFLHAIFSDTTKVFTELKGHGLGSNPKLSFGEVYINALIRSSKCSKGLRDKMFENREFAHDFAKLALLANVGRVNSTQAFFPEMRTAMKTYHPIPSLQHTDGNLQDAPRIKTCLRGCFLPDESLSTAPSAPHDILAKAESGKRPSTSVVNLITVLASHTVLVGINHFPEKLGYDFLDLFLPIPVPSAQRARAFLWLMFHYLEGPHEFNPYGDEYSQSHPGQAPFLLEVDPAELAHENVDTLADTTWGEKMAVRRANFLERQSEAEARDKDAGFKEESLASFTRSAREAEGVSRQSTPMAAPKHPRKERASRHVNTYRGPAPDVYYHELDVNAPRSAYPHEPVSPLQPEITMFEHAWNTTLKQDPLADSDGDDQDQNIKLDYERRLYILNNIRGREPTPDHIENGNRRQPILIS